MAMDMAPRGNKIALLVYLNVPDYRSRIWIIFIEDRRTALDACSLSGAHTANGLPWSTRPLEAGLPLEIRRRVEHVMVFEISHVVEMDLVADWLEPILHVQKIFLGYVH